MSGAYELSILLGALTWDAVFGEPPSAWHPVVWMGRVSRLLERWTPARGRGRQFAWGVTIALVVPLVFGGLAFFVSSLSGSAVLPGWMIWFLAVYLLKSAFSVRMLWTCADQMRRLLVPAGDLSRARSHLSHLCSRDPAGLSGEELTGATVASVAENASDSVVAPLFWFALAGVPGALAYRAINTLDARIGYRGEHEWVGKPAALLDDVVNWLPARLCAAQLLLTGALVGRPVRAAWRIMQRDARSTPSPNGGYPMAAMAGLLDVRLEKPGVYALGDARRGLQPSVISDAGRLLIGVSATSAALVVLSTCLSTCLSTWMVSLAQN